MNQITREQAFDLAKYRYKLVDREGNVYAVLGNMPDTLFIKPENGLANFIQLREIGMFYFILCRDLSQLTETIENEWESFRPIDKIQKSADYHDVITICTITKNINEWSVLEYKMAGLMHFNLGFPQETVKPL